jgi:coiled-coil domain-containing protein 151
VRLRSARSYKALDDLKDSAKDLELNSQLPHMEDNELTRCIRVLENKLDKAMIKHNEAQSIRKTYEQTAGQLKEERVGFDNQLSALERTLGAKTRDYKELQLLGGKL